jgi:hypothetical protein
MYMSVVVLLIDVRGTCLCELSTWIDLLPAFCAGYVHKLENVTEGSEGSSEVNSRLTQRFIMDVFSPCLFQFEKLCQAAQRFVSDVGEVQCVMGEVVTKDRVRAQASQLSLSSVLAPVLDCMK